MTDDQPVVVDSPHLQVLRLRLNRPTCRNAIDERTLEILQEQLASPAEPVVVIGSMPETRAFSAGGDLRIGKERLRVLSDQLFALYETMLTSTAVHVAAMRGPARGAGLQLALACDYRVAGPEFTAASIGSRHGITAGLWALPHLMGRSRALAFVASGEVLDAAAAHASGLVDSLAVDVDKAALELAATFAAAPAEHLRNTKRLTVEATVDVDRLRAERERNRNGHGG